MQRELLGKYELHESLGHGGMGEVWKALDTQLQRYVAIKLLHADRQNPDFVAQFMHEARLVASLHHPNIVQVHDFQLTDTQGRSVKAYMVMDYVEGGTLADSINANSRRGNFPAASTIVTLFTSISLALDYAHEKAMVHRDIKPANILLDKTTGSLMGEPVLTDFGIARLQGGGTSFLTHSFLGTPLYISPEQAEGRAVDARSDLYSLGIVLYEVLTGTTPFQGENPLVVMMHHVHDMPPPPAQLNPHISPALSAVVLQSIAKDPQDRFPSARAMTIALAHALNVPAPASLHEVDETRLSARYNPLQPLLGTVPAITPENRSQMPVDTYFSPAPAQNGFVPLVPSASSFPDTQIAGDDAVTMFSPRGQSFPPPLTETKQREKPLPVRRKRLVVGSVIGLLLLLILLGVVVVRPLLTATAGNPAADGGNAIVGHISFGHSGKEVATIFDQLNVDLTNVASPAPGTSYYAWLETQDDDATLQHWPVTLTNGALHAAYQSSPRYKDMFAASSKFLITEETGTPLIPNPDFTKRIYYAAIPHPSSSAALLDVRHCPTGSQADSSNVCV